MSSVLGMAVVLVPPHNFGLWDVYPVVQLQALPLLWIVTMLLCIVGAGGVVRHASGAHGVAGCCLRIMSFLLIGAVLIETALFATAGGFLPGSLATVPADRANLTVLSFNARDTGAVPIVEAVKEAGADAVLLVETDGGVAGEVAHRLRRRGLGHQVFMGSGTALSGREEVAVIVSDRLGMYGEADAPDLMFGAVTVAPQKPIGESSDSAAVQGPVLSAVHPPSPVPGKLPAGVWRRQLQAAADACRHEAAIVGGDFNASPTQISQVMDGKCLHTGMRLGRDAVGTWPTSVPAPFGASIDYQITDGERWTPVGMRILDVGQSDHRAVAVSYRALHSLAASGTW